MIELHLSAREIQDICEALDDPSISEWHKQKLLALRMHHEGAAHGFILKCLRLSPTTLVAYLREYLKGGLPEVLADRYYRPASALLPFWQCLRCSFGVAPVANAKEGVARIEALSGVRLSESQCRRVFKQMGLTLKKAAPLPAKVDPQLQLEFFKRELQPRLAQAAAGLRRVFFVDAAHFVLGAFLGMVWCFARPFIRTSPGRQRYSVLGAVDSHSKEIISLRTAGNINAQSVCDLLDLIAARHSGQCLTLIMDNARYQRCELVKLKAAALDIELLFLPAYSPNLNLIERLWKLVKKRTLTNRYYDCFAKFRHAIDTCLEDLNGPGNSQLASLLTLHFQFFKTSSS